MAQIQAYLTNQKGSEEAAKVASAAQTDMGNLATADYLALTDDAHGLLKHKKTEARGQMLKFVVDDLQSIKSNEDDKANRNQREASVEALDRKTTLQTLMSHLATKAEIAKTQVVLAFEMAYDRFRPEFLGAVKAYFDEQAEGVLAAPISKANKALGLLKHVGKDYEISAGGAKAAFPALAAEISGVAMVATFFNDMFKAEIAKKAADTVAKLQKDLDSARARLIAKVEAAVDGEVKLYAEGKMRPFSGVDVALTTLESGNPAKLTGVITLENETAELLTARLKAAIQDTGVPYQDLYNAQYEALRVAAQRLWESYKKGLGLVRPVF